MPALGPGHVVVELWSRVMEVVETTRADAAKLVPDAGGVKLPHRLARNEAERRISEGRDRGAAIDLVGRACAVDSNTGVVNEGWRENMLQTQNRCLSAAGSRPELLGVDSRI